MFRKILGPWRRVVSWARLGARAIDMLGLGLVGLFRNRLLGGGVGWLRRPLGFRLRALGGREALLDLSRPDQIVVFEEIFLERVYDLAAVPFEPEAILDCGAHVGLFTVLAAVRFPSARCIAFEPQPDNCSQARAQVERSRVGADVQEAAVGIEDGRAALVGEGCGGRLVSGGEEGAEVDVVSLPRRVGDLGARRVLLKMDIEGGELALLPVVTPLLPRETVIFFETHGGTSNWEACRAALEASGFSVRPIRRRAGKGVQDAYVDALAIRK